MIVTILLGIILSAFSCLAGAIMYRNYVHVYLSKGFLVIGGTIFYVTRMKPTETGIKAEPVDPILPAERPREHG